MGKLQQGFTVIEIAVVIVIIGVLATMTIVGYGAWRTEVATSEVQSDLNGVAAGLNQSRNFSEQGYTTFADNTVIDGSGATAAIFTPSDSITLTYRWGDGTKYCVEGVSSKNPTAIYRVSTITGEDTPVSGTCPAEP